MSLDTHRTLIDLQNRRDPTPPVSHSRAFAAQTLRILVLTLAVIWAVAMVATREAKAAEGSFGQFVEALWPDAQRTGISRETFETAFDGLKPDKSIMALTRKQAEFVKPVFAYIDSAVSAARIARGKGLSDTYSQTLDTIQSRYGVDWQIVVGVWGMESNFGSAPGNTDTIRALATLAYAQYRGDFFRNELLIALKMLEHGDVERAAMKGSWAGAMGQTQFMPSSYEKYAVAFSGAHSDIWSSAPDALASTANYLKLHGWISGQPWGYEVTLPETFDFADLSSHPMAQWSARGVTLASGEALPSGGSASLLLPMGRYGPVFLVTPNFQVIKSYNNSTSYALAVALLGDRIGGEGPLKKAWPRHMRLLNRAESLEMQRALVRLGFNVGELDGKLGDKAKEALRQYQMRVGLVPDGFPTLQLLQRMRKP